MKDKNDVKEETAVAQDAALERPAAKTPEVIPSEAGKMTIYEYEEKYVKKENARSATFLLHALAAIIGIFFFWCFFSISKSVWEVNEYAGYGAIGLSVILFVTLYLVPVIKIIKSPYFVTNVNYKTAAAAKRKNKKLRFEIAEKIVNLSSNVAGVGWYDSATVEKLEAGVKYHDDGVIKEQLTALYKGSVKKSAREVIFKASMRSGMYSALSQDQKLDSMLVAVVNLQMIKDIVFLYGFRPSDSRLVRIFGAVVRNSLVAYGVSNLSGGIARTVGDAMKGIPILGSIVSSIVDSSVQGLANGTLTAIIGYQTIRYLNVEYKLQNILDGVSVAETEEELTETCQDIEKELKKNKKGAPQSI